MITSDMKVRKLMKEYSLTNKIGLSALRADMDRKTARKYIKSEKLPSQMKIERTWKTRVSPFDAHWRECECILEDIPELEAKYLFEWLCRRYPGKYQEGQLRTFQRKCSDWRVLHGAEKEVFFPQNHEPGKRMSTDCTHADELGITINYKPFPHLLYHCVLTYSNWQWATICHSESLLALRSGIQSALFQLSHIPQEHWTDHSSAATHSPSSKDKDGHKFNQGYLDIMNHFGMKAHTIQVNSPHENGDVESLNGVLKRRMKQHLLMRGSANFKSVEEYKDFLEMTLREANSNRSERLAEELKCMRTLETSKLAEYNEHICTVRNSSTITIKRRIYSLPSRLIGKKVRVKQYEGRVDISYKGVLQLTVPWIGRDPGLLIDYRHIINSLIRKPGAFSQYKFREELYPSEVFRWAWDSLSNALNDKTAEREYLQLLHKSANSMQCEIEKILSSLRYENTIPRIDEVLSRYKQNVDEPQNIKSLVVDLSVYNNLLLENEEASA